MQLNTQISQLYEREGRGVTSMHNKTAMYNCTK